MSFIYHVPRFMDQETKVGKIQLTESQVTRLSLEPGFLPRSILLEKSVLLTTLISLPINSRQIRVEKEKEI